ncbi:hypothetical protein TCAL_14354 [Tigriopus californicus]|uniref:MBD domain-containing protein n=1 Tax=Tigriopus californicus TaxID=6832 RepID=A0A553NDB6_TIGCA|nr:hypothetical protein TCAL_14354 [Tigriopus californicus]
MAMTELNETITLESDESKPELIQTGNAVPHPLVHPVWLSPDLLRRTQNAILSQVDRPRDSPALSSSQDSDELEVLAEHIRVRPRFSYVKLPENIQSNLFEAIQEAGFTQREQILEQLNLVMDLISDLKHPVARSALPAFIMNSMVRLGKVHWHQTEQPSDSGRRASGPAQLMPPRWTDNNARSTKRKRSMPQKLVKSRDSPAVSIPPTLTSPGPRGADVGELTITPVSSPENGSMSSGMAKPVTPSRPTDGSLGSQGKDGTSVAAETDQLLASVMVVPTHSKLPPSQPVSPFQNSFQAFIQSPTFQQNMAQIAPSPVERQLSPSTPAPTPASKPAPKRRTKSATARLTATAKGPLSKIPLSLHGPGDLNGAVTISKIASPNRVSIHVGSTAAHGKKKRPSQRPKLLANNEFMKKVAKNSKATNKKIKTLSEILNSSTCPETPQPPNLPQCVSPSCELPAQSMPTPTPMNNTLVFNLDEAKGLSDLKARIKEIQNSGSSAVPETPNSVPKNIVPKTLSLAPSATQNRSKSISPAKKHGHVKKKHNEKNCQKEDIACFIKDLVITNASENNGLSFVSVDIFPRLFSDFSVNLPQLFNVICDLYSQGMNHFQFQGWALSQVSISVAKVILESLGRVPQTLYEHFCAFDSTKPLEASGTDSPSKTKIHEFHDRHEYLETLGLCTVQRARELSEAINSNKRSLRSARRSSDQSSSEGKSRPSSRASEPELDLIHRVSNSVSLKELCSGQLKPMFRVNHVMSNPSVECGAELINSKKPAVINGRKRPLNQSSKSLSINNKDASLPVGWTMIRRPRPGTAKFEVSYQSPTGRRFASLASALNNVRKMQDTPMRKSTVNDCPNDSPNNSPNDSPVIDVRLLPQTKEVTLHVESSNTLIQDKRVTSRARESTKLRPQTRTVNGIRPARKFAGNQVQLREVMVKTGGDDDSEEEPKKKKPRLSKSKRSSSTDQQQQVSPEFQLAGIKLPPHLEAGGWFTSKIEALKYVTATSEAEPRGRTSADYTALELEDEVLRAQLLAPVQSDNKKDGRILVKHWGKTVLDVIELRQWRTKIKARRKELSIGSKDDHLDENGCGQMDKDVIQDATTKAMSPVERLKALYSHLEGVSKCSELPPGWAKRTTTTSKKDDRDSVELEVTYVHKSGHQVETPLGAWQHFHRSNIKNQSVKH